MPAHPKTTDAQIIDAARELVERQGRDAFTMKDVAAKVGVRTPSLYGRFKDRDSLLGAVENRVCAEIAELLATPADGEDIEATLMAQCRALRGYALAQPESYAMVFDIRSIRTDEGTAARAAALAHLLTPLVALVGRERALLAARVLVPFMHGFIGMQNANAFRLSGDLDEAFEHGVKTILKGLTIP